MRLTSYILFLKRLALVGALAAAAMVSHAASAVTITVTNLNDDGRGSFRQALREARANDVINFAVSGTIFVRGLPLQPSFTGPILIQGPGADRLAVSGDGLVRVFSFVEAIVTVSGLTIRDGNSRSAPVSTPVGAPSRLTHL